MYSFQIRKGGHTIGSAHRTPMTRLAARACEQPAIARTETFTDRPGHRRWRRRAQPGLLPSMARRLSSPSGAAATFSSSVPWSICYLRPNETSVPLIHLILLSFSAVAPTMCTVREGKHVHLISQMENHKGSIMTKNFEPHACPTLQGVNLNPSKFTRYLCFWIFMGWPLFASQASVLFK